jgi:NADH-quinone oxidoreductase subunit N
MLLQRTDLLSILPGLLLFAGGLLAVCVDLPRRPVPRFLPGAVALSGALATLWVLMQHIAGGAPVVAGFDGTIRFDAIALVASLGVTWATVLVLAAAPADTERRRVNRGEYYGLVAFAAAGMSWLASATELVTLFVALEVLSVAVYVLTGVTRRNPRSVEASIKYLVTGAFATGFLLMGMALLYGTTGSLRLDGIAAALAGSDEALGSVGIAFVLVGLLFKLGAVPFHMWVPDVYEGAPTTTTAFMAATVKMAGLAALGRLLWTVGAARPEAWADLLWWIALATMVVGNLVALRQNSVKRMLAWSSVAHTGYALVALATLVSADGRFDADGVSAALFYGIGYVPMTLGAFYLLVYLGHEAGPRREWQDADTLDDLAGVAWRRPWAAFAMIVLLASLGGMPPTLGFLGKLWVFRAAVDQGHTLLAVLGVLAALVSWAYYLRVIVAMAMREPVAEDDRPHPAVGWVVAATVLATLWFGLMPGGIVDLVSADPGSVSGVARH